MKKMMKKMKMEMTAIKRMADIVKLCLFFVLFFLVSCYAERISITSEDLVGTWVSKSELSDGSKLDRVLNLYSGGSWECGGFALSISNEKKNEVFFLETGKWKVSGEKKVFFETLKSSFGLNGEETATLEIISFTSKELVFLYDSGVKERYDLISKKNKPLEPGLTEQFGCE